MGKSKDKGLRVNDDSADENEERHGEKFDGTNFESWAAYIENILSEKGLWDAVTENPLAMKSGEDKTTKAYVDRVKEWQTRDQKAKGKIGLRVNKQFIPIVNKEKTAFAAFEMIKSFYYSLDNETVERLEQDFANAILKKGEDALTFLIRLQNMQERLNGTESKISDSRLRNKVIQNLEKINNKWLMFISTLRMENSAMNDMIWIHFGKRYGANRFAKI
jgi:hypothetical protein